MQWLFLVFIIGSFIFAVINGKADALTEAILTSSGDGVTLTLTLLGGMGFWSGIMKIAEDSGLSRKLYLLLKLPLRLLFRKLEDETALELIGMNVSANLLGLGNAATPSGLRAMKRLDELNHRASAPSYEMILFTVINTASIQLIPTTVALLRSEAGSNQPFSILPASVLTSVCTLTVAILSISLFHRKDSL